MGEQQYFDLIQQIIDQGTIKEDRTGVGTKSIFGHQMSFYLWNNQIPLLTFRKINFKSILHELLWFISGSTNVKKLQEQNVHIWDQNSDRAFLDRLKFFDRIEGDAGPIYGFQWRHFGAKYIDCQTDYTGQGFDQLADVIHKLKNNPTSRRIIMSAWNPLDLKEMVLPPCHVLCQFDVTIDETGEKNLSCLVYQRSADVALGVPFNIASYAILTHMIAHIVGMKPDKLVYMTGDTHIYLNHIDVLQSRLNEIKDEKLDVCGHGVYQFPELQINRQVTDIDDFKFSDFDLSGYNSRSSIKMEMAV